MNFESLDSLQAGSPRTIPGPQKQFDIGEGLYRQALSVLRSSFSEMVSAFDSLPPSDPWRRRAVKDFVGSEEIKRIEAAVNGQCAIVRGGATMQERQAALARVEEGMEYYRKAVLFRMKGKAA